jgi:hypothetical protein
VGSAAAKMGSVMIFCRFTLWLAWNRAPDCWNSCTRAASASPSLLGSSLTCSGSPSAWRLRWSVSAAGSWRGALSCRLFREAVCLPRCARPPSGTNSLCVQLGVCLF